MEVYVLGLHCVCMVCECNLIRVCKCESMCEATYLCVRACMPGCVRTYVRTCVCVRARARVCVRVCVRSCMKCLIYDDFPLSPQVSRSNRLTGSEPLFLQPMLQFLRRFWLFQHVSECDTKGLDTSSLCPSCCAVSFLRKLTGPLC